MRKVRQDGGIRYHVNVLQAMVSIHKRLSAGKHVTGTKRGKTCKEWRARKNALNNLFGFAPDWFKNTAVCPDWSDHVLSDVSTKASRDEQS